MYIRMFIVSVYSTFGMYIGTYAYSVCLQCMQYIHTYIICSTYIHMFVY